MRNCSKQGRRKRCLSHSIARAVPMRHTQREAVLRRDCSDLRRQGCSQRASLPCRPGEGAAHTACALRPAHPSRPAHGHSAHLVMWLRASVRRAAAAALAARHRSTRVLSSSYASSSFSPSAAAAANPEAFSPSAAAAADPEAFWSTQAAALDWFKPPTRAAPPPDAPAGEVPFAAFGFATACQPGPRFAKRSGRCVSRIALPPPHFSCLTPPRAPN